MILKVHESIEADVQLAQALQATFRSLCLIGTTTNTAPSAHVDAARAFSFLIGARRLDLLTQALHDCLSQVRARMIAEAA